MVKVEHSVVSRKRPLGNDSRKRSPVEGKNNSSFEKSSKEDLEEMMKRAMSVISNSTITGGTFNFHMK